MIARKTASPTLPNPSIAIKALAIGFFLWLLILLSPGLRAQTVYTVSVQDIDYYPLYRTSSDGGDYDGYLRDVLDAFAQQQGIHFDYRPRPIRRGAAEFLGGQLDFILPAHPQWNHIAKAGKRIHYSQPLVYFEDAILVPEEKQDLRPGQMRELGTIHGFTPWKFAGDIDAGRLRVETARTPENLIRMALRGRVDMINLALPVARYHLEQMDPRGTLVPAAELMNIERSRYHLASMKHPEVIEAFNQYLSDPPARLTQVIEGYESYGLIGPVDGDWEPGGSQRELAGPEAKPEPGGE
ncbi:hypothetical protein RE428_47940 [Marinobacter nanhaiticus D15-8W]|uniref:Uncharacterized protein n=1 Tax=Marinobacter nanhaiticus D15-8W TaxID=626887 RepID=N6X2R7_9GAMM|nr:transporter substrate-binding domain-containing protein [Marinobacter nanhaiticus]ENO15378.1 hypothetical protein J057_08506 [Marinobacter nanhaiticus D15-8W]BES73776.1 hypothetical protein RE428_47940 [Marinobacter nanhaiticus D15-8W]